MSAEHPEQREIGIVKFYNPRKGYGFITRPDGSDVFFHLTHMRTLVPPAPGNAVRFKLGQNREGLTAEEIALVPLTEVERYGGTITALDEEGGAITTPDNFTITFRRSDFVPYTRADSLRVGDEVEMNFLIGETDGGWRAAVVRPPDFDASPPAAQGDRREADDEEENRRLLGILYKTDLDEEATHAAQLLTERNMRATLSALVSRLFDRRLSRQTRHKLVASVPDIYFDDECQTFLQGMSERLERTLAEEDAELSPASCEALSLLLDEQQFPTRWSQYMLPFGLALLRNLSSVPGCHSLLEEPETETAAEAWLGRVCRHVQQRRSGHGYITTTTLLTLDELWQRELLQAASARILPRLISTLDADSLGNQVYHLRDKLNAGFLRALLPHIAEHPDLPGVLDSPAHADTFRQWLEPLEDSPEGITPGVAARLLPVLEKLAVGTQAEHPLQGVRASVTRLLSPESVAALLAEGGLPEPATWACFGLLDSRGELNGLLVDAAARRHVTDWLRVTSEQRPLEPPQEHEVNTALKLIDSLRQNEELRGELTGIGESLFAGLQQRIERADSQELMLLLERIDVDELPGVTAALARRLRDSGLDAEAQQRVLAHFAERRPAVAAAASALLAWRRERSDLAALGRLVELASGEEPADAEVAAFTEVVKSELAEDDLRWHEGFVQELRPEPAGGPQARIEGFDVLLPRRLFADGADFAPNRPVRLVYRRGIVLGVVPAQVQAACETCGRLQGPLTVDERNAMVGTVVDAEGEPCLFEAGNLAPGESAPLLDGMLLRFTRLAAVAGGGHRWVAFNVSPAFAARHLALLLGTFVAAKDEGVAQAALRTALGISPIEASTLWAECWGAVDESRRQALCASLDEPAARQLRELVGQD